MSYMKSATVREVQHHLGRVLEWVEHGEEVLVLRRRKVVARLVPPSPEIAATPDFVARAQEVWGNKPRGKRLSSLVDEGRGPR